VNNLDFLEGVIRRAEKDGVLTASTLTELQILTDERIMLRKEATDLVKNRDRLTLQLEDSEWKRRKMKYPFKIFGNRTITIRLGKPKKKPE